MNVIETTYRGYHFRSRTEARWAVFFDALKIDFEYEKEAFNLGGAGCYLPDFWLPQVRMWAEVKGQAMTPEEKEKCLALTVFTSHPCLELVGAPQNKPYRAWNPLPGIADIESAWFCLTHHKGYPEHEHRFFWATPEMDAPGFAEQELIDEFRDTIAAVQAARAYRFDQARG